MDHTPIPCTYHASLWKGPLAQATASLPRHRVGGGKALALCVSREVGVREVFTLEIGLECAR